MAHVIVYQSYHARSRVISAAMMAGIRRLGLDKVQHLLDSDYRGTPDADVAVFYGVAGKLKQVMEDYIAAGKKALYIDLGYWGRHMGGRRQGFHKIVLNGRHPTPYYRNLLHAKDRWKKFGLGIAAWKKPTPDKAILVAGISAKGARFEGFEPLTWEANAISQIRKVTDRRIIYRPKPTCPFATPIRGVDYSPPGEPLDLVLAKTACVVSHHSNTNIESLLRGIPSYTQEGVAIDQSQTDFSKIEEFVMRDDREQWCADIAYTQWSVAEMAQGLPWLRMKDENLIP
jgi:hypothetical protein